MEKHCPKTNASYHTAALYIIPYFTMFLSANRTEDLRPNGSTLKAAMA